MPSSNPNLGVSTMQKHEEYYLRDGTVCFLVENTLFRIHRYFFERESDYFRERLAPSIDEDGSPDSPYIIHDIKTHEFADFVWVFYNPRYSFSKQTKEKWLNILRLATLWRFGEIRKLAIRHLEKIKFEAVEKIATYKLYAIDGTLLLPSYVSLCTSPKLPSPAEGKILSMETVLRIASARERVLLRASELGCKTPTIASAPEDIVKAIVAELFDPSLTAHSSDQGVRVDGQAQINGNATGGSSVDPETVTVKQPVPPKKVEANGGVQGPQRPSVNGAGGKGSGKQRA